MSFSQEELLSIIRKQVQIEIKKMFPIGQWHNGKVASVINSKQLSVYIDGSTIAQKVSCNPDITFNIGDEVWVIYPNNSIFDKYVLAKRGV